MAVSNMESAKNRSGSKPSADERARQGRRGNGTPSPRDGMTPTMTPSNQGSDAGYKPPTGTRASASNAMFGGNIMGAVSLQPRHTAANRERGLIKVGGK